MQSMGFATRSKIQLTETRSRLFETCDFSFDISDL